MFAHISSLNNRRPILFTIEVVAILLSGGGQRVDVVSGQRSDNSERGFLTYYLKLTPLIPYPLQGEPLSHAFGGIFNLLREGAQVSSKPLIVSGARGS
jgi:hypothetical protein